MKHTKETAENIASFLKEIELVRQAVENAMNDGKEDEEGSNFQFDVKDSHRKEKAKMDGEVLAGASDSFKQAVKADAFIITSIKDGFVNETAFGTMSDISSLVACLLKSDKTLEYNVAKIMMQLM